jgi:hypothetical protein
MAARLELEVGMGRAGHVRAIHNSRVEIIGCCPRGGAELACACCFAAVELAIHSSGAELAHARHPCSGVELGGGCPRGGMKLARARHPQ